MGGTDNTGIDELGPVDYLVVEFHPELRTLPARWRPSWSACPRRECPGAGPADPAEGGRQVR